MFDVDNSNLNIMKFLIFDIHFTNNIVNYKFSLQSAVKDCNFFSVNELNKYLRVVSFCTGPEVGRRLLRGWEGLATELGRVAEGCNTSH